MPKYCRRLGFSRPQACCLVTLRSAAMLGRLGRMLGQGAGDLSLKWLRGGGGVTGRCGPEHVTERKWVNGEGRCIGKGGSGGSAGSGWVSRRSGARGGEQRRIQGREGRTGCGPAPQGRHSFLLLAPANTLFRAPPTHRGAGARRRKLARSLVGHRERGGGLETPDFAEPLVIGDGLDILKPRVAVRARPGPRRHLGCRKEGLLGFA